ncbi:hypothetical protein AN189_10210 [Loktanella sp. 3ANDIMAR09]|uniref:hypothetical protein n=1 Tax=Loktanella sp. 3ANDIMAR09 TaxID=1225657 RepID=UPI0006F9D94F|nr:hypothetical protein [Loktanella sp. 3ANDIMAR09]KQI68206.1 hypothetical protein AN189_10210 [Loktanella sp. 3ANDIMAR09]
MDYSKSGVPKPGRNAPKTRDGKGRNPQTGDARNDKAALLERMKAGRAAKLAETGGLPLDRPNEGADKIAIDEMGPKTVRGPEKLDK